MRLIDADALLKAVERYFTGALTASEREKTYWSGDPYEQASVNDDDFCSYGEREGE